MSKRNIEQLAQDTNQVIKKSFKNRVYDIIGVGLLLAMLALNLGVLELRDITLNGIIVILLECIPFCLTAVLLSINFYSKGASNGKETQCYKDAIEAYSKKIEGFTGEQVDSLSDFCAEYNDKILRKLQENILKRAAISYERFNDETYDNSGNLLQPLKVLSKSELLTLYNEERVNIIFEAKRVQIKGLTENALLGTSTNIDTTDLGSTEKEMKHSRERSYIIRYLFSTLLMSIIGIRDILQWGWSGLLLIAFKLIFILCMSLMNNFKGYDDITIDLVNHIVRKTDILKQFEYWYETKYIKNNDEVATQLELKL